MGNGYQLTNRRKYALKVHIVLVTKYRKPLLISDIANDVKEMINRITADHERVVLAMETDRDHIHILLEYDATERVCDIVKEIKQTTTYFLWQKYGTCLSRHYWKKRVFWSDGYFACSIGEVSSATIQKYFESQG